MINHCRFCNEELKITFVDLGLSPLSNSYLKIEQLEKGENFYPLHAFVCEECLLVQLAEFESPQNIFSDYAYFSSYSKTWLEHAENYVKKMVSELALNSQSQVIEIASNDGYLLQYFKERKIPVLGIEPAGNVAKVAIDKGIPSLVKFFGVETARDLVAQNLAADLLLGNNVFAHVPNLHDFVEGLKIVLKKDGIITLEFPHLLKLMQKNQFDTIYHEHFSYFSLLAVEKIFADHHLQIFDVEELVTHGGSIRIYGSHEKNKNVLETDRLKELRQKELNYGLDKIQTYFDFKQNVEKTKRDILSFLIEAKNLGKVVVGYGAPAKGNTLLNYCGVRTDLIDYTVDLSPHKQGLFLPGTRIPIYSPDKIKETKPDYLLILPWNIKEEIMQQMSFISEWGGQFVVPIPKIEVF